MILWNGRHGADSAVVPCEMVLRAVSLAVSVSGFTKVYRSDLAFDVLVRW
jgi:hypothetical protein